MYAVSSPFITLSANMRSKLSLRNDITVALRWRRIAHTRTASGYSNSSGVIALYYFTQYGTTIARTVTQP